MKIRTDFVTNSSSSSFVSFAVWSQEIADFVLELTKGQRDCCSQWTVGELTVNGDIVSAVTTMDLAGSYYVYSDEVRTSQQKQHDDNKANTPENIAEVFRQFLPQLTPEQKKQLDELLADAADDGHTVGSTYMDEADGFDRPHYSHSDFKDRRLILDKNGRLTGCRENSKRTTIIIPSYTVVCRNAFQKCKKTKRIEVQAEAVLQEGALSECQSIDYLDLSEWSDTIPARLCENCRNLTTVVLPDLVYCINVASFAGCANLTNINIPDSVLYIHPMAFDGCEKLPQQVKEKIKALSDKTALNRVKAETETYIRNNGFKTFSFNGHSYGELFEKKRQLELWHAAFDLYFDYPERLPKKKKTYMLYATKKVNVDTSRLGWKSRAVFTPTIDYLIVDTDRIADLQSFAEKQDAFAKGNLQKANRIGSNMLEKAVELKKSGHPIQIITKAHLEACIATNSFA